LFGTYEYLDSNPCCEVNYYRVAQVNTDGYKQYSGIVKLGNTLDLINSRILAYPNPVLKGQDQVYLKPSPTSGSVVRFYNSLGQLVQEATMINSGMKMDVSGLPSGMYLMAIDEGQSVQCLKIVIH
jgi:hypothetical protein